MSDRFRQVLLVVSLLWLSWLAMMLAHETGHVIGAVGSGGTVRRVVWHPAVISRTDVQPNPHPLIEVWAGPVIGCIVPLVLAGLASAMRLRIGYLIWVVAGFCLIANGAYIGVGTIDPVGDGQELIAHGAPRWSLGMFGVVAVLLGFFIWDRVSPRLGFGRRRQPIRPAHAYVTFVLAVFTTGVGWILGNRG